MVQRPEPFSFIAIQPSHYDDDGYVVQWAVAALPANTLYLLHGIAEDCAERNVLGPGVELRFEALNEYNTRIRPDRIARRLGRTGGKALIGLVGVQSNQFPRALDLARRFRAHGLPVVIGGFHVSGCLSMLDELPPDLEEARELGVTLFAGEAEGRLETLLVDALSGKLKPVYDFMSDLCELEGAPLPVQPPRLARRTVERQASFDAGRGCPFQCSFCCIINVQGRKSRYRSPDDVERLVRRSAENGVGRFFITDDNFARNRNWEAIFDRLIHLREVEGMALSFTIQSDTLCHKIPNFVEKAGRAGVERVFVGLESINPKTLLNAKKRQNRIHEYRALFQAWKRVGAITYCGYILGFPTDTAESLRHDIEVIKRELPLDILEFFYLTPLPGSEDHKTALAEGRWLDPDLNKYDLEHVTWRHPSMTAQEWDELYRWAWRTYYDSAHVRRLVRRFAAYGHSPLRLCQMIAFFSIAPSVEKIHPLQAGMFRRKDRTDRRPGFPIENIAVFYARLAWHHLRATAKVAQLSLRLAANFTRVMLDPRRRDYTDMALAPVRDDEVEDLQLFRNQDARKAAERAIAMKRAS